MERVKLLPSDADTQLSGEYQVSFKTVLVLLIGMHFQAQSGPCVECLS